MLSVAVLAVMCVLMVVCDVDWKPCAPRRFNYDSVVCVCNSSYCDSQEPVNDELLASRMFFHYTSSKDGRRLHKSVNPISWKTFNKVADKDSAHFKVDHRQEYQTMLGFGATLTDSTAINVAMLTPQAQENLIRSLFAKQGLGYNLIRVPMGCTPFSSRNYSFDGGPKDEKFQKFKLAKEDLDFKIPFLKMVNMVSPLPVLLYLYPGEPPRWMIGNNKLTGKKRLLPDYYQMWADYYIKFIQLYGQADLHFWGVSTQNEPNDDKPKDNRTVNIVWQPKEHSKWLQDNLGPTLETMGFGYLRILILEDTREFLPNWAQEILESTKARDLADIIAVHWYKDATAPVSLLNQTHNQFPDKNLLYTEASFNVNMKGSPAVRLGFWERAEDYASSIIEVTNNWATGWMELNMVLDQDGGPNWLGKFADASIIINATSDEFYKQPMFYAIAHFSKFIPRGSRHIKLQALGDNGIRGVAFTTPSKSVVIVLQNRKDAMLKAVIDDPKNGRLDVQLPANSIHTLIYNNIQDISDLYTKGGSKRK